jgi:hypothetical protein
MTSDSSEALTVLSYKVWTDKHAKPHFNIKMTLKSLKPSQSAATKTELTNTQSPTLISK